MGQRLPAAGHDVRALDHREFDLIARGVQRCFALYGDAPRWRNLAVVVNRDFATGS